MTEFEINAKESDIFVISPDREATAEEKNFLENYVREQEKEGKIVYFPSRDTDQNDPVGLRICLTNREAIRKTKEVHAYFNGRSQGTFFDLGMSFMAKKPLYFIGTKIKTLDDAFGSLGLECPELRGMKFSEWAEKERAILEDVNFLGRGYKWEENNPNFALFLFNFGMAFMADIDIYLKNPREVKRTLHKSFQNVLLELHEICKGDIYLYYTTVPNID